jgi:hypothetical protein
MNETFQINFLAVLTACVASFVFAGVWFGLVIAKGYVVALGRESLPAQKPTLLFILGPTVCNLIMVLASAMLMKSLGIQGIEQASYFGLLIGIGYLVPTCMTIAINPNFPRPFMYTFLNAPYFVLNSLMTSLILVSFHS